MIMAIVLLKNRKILCSISTHLILCTIFITEIEQETDNELTLKMMKLNHIF